MIDINTLMIQRALTSLIWEHVNPYRRFDLDIESRRVW
jgi:hypothetical protein